MTDALETRVETLEDQVRKLSTLLDIEQIKNLQRIYGFYLEHWMYDEIVDCFADGPDVYMDFFPGGKYLGKDGVKRYFKHFSGPNPEFLHQIMQLSPVIHVDEGGKTARGRWYGYGPLAIPVGKGVLESVHSGTYEMEYIKEDDIWKIKVFRWKLNYISYPGKGFVSPERTGAVDPDVKLTGPEPDTPRKDYECRYPSGYIFPFHYNHPVTGKKTSEEENNKALKG